MISLGVLHVFLFLYRTEFYVYLVLMDSACVLLAIMIDQMADSTM
jgi:hypothetical protein